MGSSLIGKCLRTTAAVAASEGEDTQANDQRIESPGEEEDKIEDRLFIVKRRVDLR
jgi:hypothetical protein